MPNSYHENQVRYVDWEGTVLQCYIWCTLWFQMAWLNVKTTAMNNHHSILTLLHVLCAFKNRTKSGNSRNHKNSNVCGLLSTDALCAAADLVSYFYWFKRVFRLWHTMLYFGLVSSEVNLWNFSWRTSTSVVFSALIHSATRHQLLMQQKISAGSLPLKHLT